MLILDRIQRANTSSAMLLHDIPVLVTASMPCQGSSRRGKSLGSRFNIFHSPWSSWPCSIRKTPECLGLKLKQFALKHLSFFCYFSFSRKNTHALQLATNAPINLKVQHPPPRATSLAFELLKIGLFKFPPLGARKPFKCPTD